MKKPSVARTTLENTEGTFAFTVLLAVGAKIGGTILLPGARGNLSDRAVRLLEATSWTLSYVLVALLLMMVGTSAVELSRVPAHSKGRSRFVRFGVVTATGIVLALAAPAVAVRLVTGSSVALALVTSFLALTSGLAVFRVPAARALGAVLALLSFSALVRVVAWEASAIAFHQQSPSLFHAGRALSAIAVLVQAFAVLIVSMGLNVSMRGGRRLLTSVALGSAFAVTWLAGRTTESPSVVEAILRASIPASIASPSPLAVTSLAAFLLPWSLLLAAFAILLPRDARRWLGPMALALVSQGAFDVPMHALLMTASAHWALLESSSRRYLRDGDQQPMSGALESPLPRK